MNKFLKEKHYICRGIELLGYYKKPNLSSKPLPTLHPFSQTILSTGKLPIKILLQLIENRIKITAFLDADYFPAFLFKENQGMRLAAVWPSRIIMSLAQSDRVVEKRTASMDINRYCKVWAYFSSIYRACKCCDIFRNLDK
jgi:hypothetical protein